MDWEYMIIVIIIMITIVYNLCRKNSESEVKETLYDEKIQILNEGQISYKSIALSIKDIQDKELKKIASDLYNYGGKILAYLNDNPQSIPIARQFLNYYLNRTALILKQCVILEKTMLNSQDANDILDESKNTLYDFYRAYEKQFEKIMNMHLNEMGAELNVARQILNEDGVEKKARPVFIEMNEEKSIENSSSNKWLTPKTVGTAAIAILSAVGIYKLLNNKKDEK